MKLLGVQEVNLPETVKKNFTIRILVRNVSKMIVDIDEVKQIIKYKKEGYA